MKDIVIIGGGASGLIASIIIKRELKENAQVTVLERLERVGKKILATGNGRCNITNDNLKIDNYNNPKFIKPLLKKLDVLATKELFEEMGLMLRTQSEGRVYPVSEISSSVLDVLRNEMRRIGIVEKCNWEAKKITYRDNQYLIESSRNDKVLADYLILATGGKSDPVLGSNGSGYSLLKPFKIKITDTYPGLVGLKLDSADIKGLDGIRYKSSLKVTKKNSKDIIWQRDGEIQFKADGISGIVAMELSSYLSRNLKAKESSKYNVYIDFCPDISLELLEKKLLERFYRMRSLGNESFLLGMFQRLMGNQLLKRARIDVSGYIKALNKHDLKRLAFIIKNYEINIKDSYGFEKSQVTIGGIDLDEVDSKTLELTKCPNLYVSGEILDIDGMCGGYNLQWAWTSGYVVATNIVKKVLEDNHCNETK